MYTFTIIQRGNVLQPYIRYRNTRNNITLSAVDFNKSIAMHIE